MMLNDVEYTTFKMFVMQMSNYLFVISFQLMFYKTLPYRLARGKSELDCFNCKAGGFLRLFTLMFTKGKQLQSILLRKTQLVYGEHLTIIKKLKAK